MTDLSLINAALTRTGNSPLTDLAESKIGAVIASQNYELVVKAELAIGRWKVPTKTAQLSLVNEAEMGGPPEPWLFSYQLPSDLVAVRTVMVSGQPIAYETMGRYVFCNFDNTVPVVGKYLWRIPEEWFPPALAEGITRRMEAVFLRGIHEDYREAAARDEMADDILAKARTVDAQSQTPINPVNEPVMRARGATPSTTLRARRGF